MNNVYPRSSTLRARGKTPRVAHVSRSVPILVRDGIMARIKAMPWFTGHGFQFTTNKALQIQPESLPLVGVYLITENMAPDGDANAGEPRFRTTARYGISVIALNNDADAAEYTIDFAWRHIAGLFSDPTLYNNSKFQIQAYVGGSRSHVFGSLGQDNELPIAELRFDLTCDLGTEVYPPLVLDDLEVIHVTTAFPVGGSDAERAAIKQVNVEYDIPQE